MKKFWLLPKNFYTLINNPLFMKYLKDFEQWDQPQFSESKNFVCGHCNEHVASHTGFFIIDANSRNGIFAKKVGGIYICPHCEWPNFLSPQGEWIPGQSAGKNVENLPENVQILYEEARNCIKNKCYSATILVCRKILMHVCIEEWAEEGKNFTFYVDFLLQNGYLPTQKNNWTDKIRTSGNNMNHKNIIWDKENAENILQFTQLILQLMYEFPNT